MPFNMRQLLGEDTTWRLADLIARFLDDTTELLNTHGCGGGEWRPARDPARRASPQIQQHACGAPLLSDLCDQLEHALRTSIPIDVRAYVERITTEFARVKATLTG